MPLNDWQFWVVTVIAVLAIVMVLRLVLPSRRASGGGQCPTCTTGDKPAAKRRVLLTIERRRVS